MLCSRNNLIKETLLNKKLCRHNSPHSPTISSRSKIITIPIPPPNPLGPKISGKPSVNLREVVGNVRKAVGKCPEGRREFPERCREITADPKK